jgi:hypothetical protein
MILVDTPIWIDHLRSGNVELAGLLQRELVCSHHFVIGELACGNLRNRQEVLGLLQSLPQLAPATEDEVLFLVEQHRLMGRGIGYIDAHLLAAAVIHDARLWTKDKRLAVIAAEKNRGYTNQPN